MTKHAIFARNLIGLVPANDEAFDCLRGVKVGERVAVKINRPRNRGAHDLYWSLCGKLADSLGRNKDEISDYLKIRTGHCTIISTKTGEYKLPRSISWAAMNGSDFSKFLDECVRVIISEWLPHMSDEEVRQELLDMVTTP